MKKRPCLTCFPLGEDSAGYVTADKSDGFLYIHLTSSLQACLGASSLSPKAISQAETAASSQQSASNTLPSTLDSSSPLTTGYQKPISSDIPSGQSSKALSGQSENEYQIRGSESKDLAGLPYKGMTEHRASALDRQVGGSHYKDFAIQPIEFIHQNGIGFIAGNVIKYVCRYRAKGGTTDLLKAKHYVELLLEQERQSS